MEMESKTNSSVRLFIAIDLPSQVKTTLQRVQSSLRQHDLAVRWVNPDNTHLTLKFLGEVQKSLIDALVEQITDVAARHQPIELQTDKLGVFPNHTRPRVVWLGLGGDLLALQRLQADVEQAVIPLGFAPEQRSFAPHLTLGRTIKDADKSRMQIIGQTVMRTHAPSPVQFDVKEIVLMRSHLYSSGARYTTLAKAPLGR
jgi:2'-5' RNA ligase